MGVVWKASDTALDRDVAIKFLPPAFSADAERLARFDREAKLLAQLNHPNIAQIYGLHETPGDGGRFLAMEFIAGEDLSTPLERGALPYESAIKIAAQTASALEAAHRAGVVHRDLKPANIRIARDGSVKVLDLGLAKAVAPDAASSGSPSLTASPTMTSAGTVAGLILGTAAYMSPEQARGAEVDARTDVWAWGCVTFEMLTGHRLFAGETISDSIASILRTEPPWEKLPAGTPRALRRLLERCLAKDADRRMHSMADVRIELDEAAALTATSEVDAPGERSGTAGGAAASTKAPRWALATIGVLALAAIGLGARAFLAGGGDSRSALRIRVSHETFYAGQEQFPKVSPDGNFLVYATLTGDGRSDLYLQRVGGSNPINLTNDPETADFMPAFSPDGASIAFCSQRDGGGIYVMGATGESVRRLTVEGFDPAWSPDGTQIAYAEEGSFDPLSRNIVSRLFVVDVATGESREIFAGDAVQPSWSPNGHRIAFWGSTAEARGQRDLFSVNRDGTDLVRLTDDADVDWNPVWAPDGRHLYFASDRGGTMNLWRVPMNERTGQANGDFEPVPVPAAWVGWISIADDGRIAYLARDSRSSLMKMPLDPATLESAGSAETVTSGAIVISEFAVSPDGSQIVFRSSGVREDIYLIGSDGAGMRKLTDDPARDRGPSWSPDGRSILFYSTRSGRYELWSIATDGSNARPLSALEDTSLWYPTLSPDGSRLAVWNGDGAVLFDMTAIDGPLTLQDGTRLPPVYGEDGDGGENGEDGTRMVGPGPMRWSLDGRYLAGLTRESPSRPIVYDVRSGEFVTFDESWTNRVAFGWLDDGRVLITDDVSFYAVDLKTGRITAAVRSWDQPEDIHFGIPTPDARLLYFLVTSVESDIWLAEIR